MVALTGGCLGPNCKLFGGRARCSGCPVGDCTGLGPCWGAIDCGPKGRNVGGTGRTCWTPGGPGRAGPRGTGAPTLGANCGGVVTGPPG